VKVRDYELACDEHGTGSTILCIHGSLDDLRTWSRQMAPLGAQHRVIAYSRRWHWPNAEADGQPAYRATEHVADLIAIIESLGAGGVHLVGASYGGILAMLAAVQRPELVRSMVVGEAPLFTVLPVARREAQAAHAIFPARDAYDAGDPVAGLGGFLEKISGAGSFATFPEGARAVALANQYEFGLEVHSSEADYFGPLTVEDLRTVNTPALLVRGERSPKIFGDVLDVLAATLPRAKRLDVPGASHGMHRHNPAVYNAAVLDFIAGAEDRDGAETK
jgi:pimeloyl-ACP methyl ester carboxylesterase